MANGYFTETCRDGIQPGGRVRCYREVLTPSTLRGGADVVKADRGILDYQIGAVNER